METLDYDNRTQTETTPKMDRNRGNYDTFGNMEPKVLDFGQMNQSKRNEAHGASASRPYNQAIEDDDGANRLRDLNDHVSVMDNQS